MKIFILSASLNDFVENIEAYDTFEEAKTEAIRIAAAWGVTSRPTVSLHATELDGWVVYDEKPNSNNNYQVVFITIVTRSIHYKSIAADVTYESIIDKLKDLVTQPPAVPVVTATQQPKDDFFDLTLPGGFSKKDKPLTLKEVCDAPHDVKSIFQLTEAQSWALATARIKKRPSFMLLLPGVGVYTQRYALEELALKSKIGASLAKEEMGRLQAIYDSEQKPSWQTDEEESSSSEEDDGSYNYRY